MTRGYFGIGTEGISKSANMGALMRTAHAFGAAFCFSIGAGYDARAARQADEDCNAQLARRLEEILSGAVIAVPRFNPLRYRVAIEIYDYVMRLAFRTEGQERVDLLREAKHAFLTYLDSAESRG